MPETTRNSRDRCHPDRIEDHFYGTVTVGERGQIVIPAEARREYEIETGDKLLVMGHPTKHGVVICKIDQLREFLTQMIEGLRIVESKAIEADDDDFGRAKAAPEAASAPTEAAV